MRLSGPGRSDRSARNTFALRFDGNPFPLPFSWSHALTLLLCDLPIHSLSHFLTYLLTQTPPGWVRNFHLVLAQKAG